MISEPWLVTVMKRCWCRKVVPQPEDRGVPGSNGRLPGHAGKAAPTLELHHHREHRLEHHLAQLASFYLLAQGYHRGAQYGSSLQVDARARSIWPGMAVAYRLPALSLETTKNLASLLRLVIIFLIAGAAISSRLFAVVRHESIIHEFDPWFNFRATKVLAKDGFYRFWNWFDQTAWYPLGRAAGGTVYPGLMVTSGAIYNFLHAINLPVDIRNICVLLAPAFSGLTAWATYLFARQMKDDAAGLLAAAFIGIAPGECGFFCTVLVRVRRVDELKARDRPEEATTLG